MQGKRQEGRIDRKEEWDKKEEKARERKEKKGTQEGGRDGRKSWPHSLECCSAHIGTSRLALL